MPRSLRFRQNATLLLIAAVIGQGVALAVGLWLEQKLVESSLTWSEARYVTTSKPTSANGGTSLTSIPDKQLLAAGTMSTQLKLIVFFWTFVSQTVIVFLLLSRWNTLRARQRDAAAIAMAKQAHDLIRTRDAVIFGLAKLAESRDPDTGHHLERIARYSYRLAEAMRFDSRFAAEITPSFLKSLGISSALHDIGKVGIEDAILLKPGRLTELERLRIQQHTILGGECIQEIEKRLGTSNFLQMAREIAFHHHERWDGTGYPFKLASEQIPLAARIVAVADVYDALSVRRVYKRAFPHEKCVRMIAEGAGSQFDPHIVEIFLQIQDDFRQCAVELSDATSDREPRETEAEVGLTSDQQRLLVQLDQFVMASSDNGTASTFALDAAHFALSGAPKHQASPA